MQVRSNYILILLFIIFVSCKKESTSSEKELFEIIKDEDNGFSQSKIINGVTINSVGLQTALILTQEISNDSSNKSFNEKKIREKYKKNIYFILSYSKENKELLSNIRESREKFNSIQNTLTFEMFNKVSLTNQNKDTLRLIDYNFPRTYGMSKSTNLIFVFERNKILEKSDELFLNIKDIGIGIGDISFKYNPDLIKTN